MTRKGAILTLLGSTLGGVRAIAQDNKATRLHSQSSTVLIPGEPGFKIPENGTVYLSHSPMSIRVELSDEKSKTYGIGSIVVKYNGKEHTISAKEIWEALTGTLILSNATTYGNPSLANTGDGNTFVMNEKKGVKKK